MKIVKTLVFATFGLIATYAGVQSQGKTWTKVTIATEGAYAPWNFTEAGGKLAGFEIDLGNELCKRMKVECTIIAQDWDGIIPALQAGKYDAIMAGMNVTEKRLETINFSSVYGTGGQVFGVAKGGPLAALPGLNTRLNLTTGEADALKMITEMKTLLKGKTVGVQVSTINAQFLDKYFKDTVTIKEYKTTEEHDLDLANGRLDAIFVSVLALNATIEKPQFKNLLVAGPSFGGGLLGSGVAVGLRKADTELKALFDKAIAAMVADGTLRTLAVKWFKLDISPQS